jgi:hypothetical protein
MSERKARLLLLTSGGSVAHNFLDALGARRDRCELIGANSVAEAASNFRFDSVYLIPPTSSGEQYIQRVVELIRETQPDLVIPCRDDDVLALAHIRERRACDALLLVGSLAAANMMNDKLETARFATRHGLPFASTAANASGALGLVEACGLPLVGKPRSGNASRGVVLLRSVAEIERAFSLRGDLIAQPYLDPPPDFEAAIAPFDAGLPVFFSVPGRQKYSVQTIIGPEGDFARIFGTFTPEPGSQPIDYWRRDDADLIELGENYARALSAEGWRGPLNVQLKRTPAGKPVPFELNGRFTGGTGPRALLGYDEVGEVFRRFLPWLVFEPVAPSSSDRVQNYLHGYPMPGDAVTALQELGTWSRPKR